MDTASTQNDNAESRPYLDDLAELYDRFMTAMDQSGNPVNDWLAQTLPRSGRALDVGCGNGRHCRMFADRFEEVVGVDVSPRVIKIAIAKESPSHIRYECREVSDLTPERDGLFDVVFSIQAVFSMGSIDDVLPRLREMVAPGGWLVIVDMSQQDTLAPEKSANQKKESDTRRSSFPFEVAHEIYRASNSTEAAIDSLRFMLHPRWQEMNRAHTPFSITEFRGNYVRHLPGVRFDENIIPTLTGVLWQAPAA